MAFTLYRRLSFEGVPDHNPEVVSYAAAIDRSPDALALKLVEIGNSDPARVIAGKINGIEPAQAVRNMWDYIKVSPDAFAVESQDALNHYGITPMV